MSSARFPAASLAAGLVLTAVVACVPFSSAVTRTSHMPYVPHAGSSAKAELTLSNRDNDRSVSVERGEVVTVRLVGSRAEQATWKWEVPAAADGHVLERTDTSTSRNGDAWAAFLAENDGTTTIDSVERCAPNPGYECPGAVMDWKVTVTVR
ncbi:hypothetical protein CTZ27_37890 [Streptomyces griseocarneus]|nr:hypothetical protein CTZ27_37890 [Streptomyces griseocarneus]